MSKKIVLATFGSLGDLHPFLALASGLKARGCLPVIATHELYRKRIEDLGIGFAPLRPDYRLDDSHLNLLSMDPWRGTETILRQGLLPYLRETYDDLEIALEGAALLVSHAIVFPAPLLAEKKSIPWVSAALSPIALWSAFDPPYGAPVPWVNKLCWSLGPSVNRILIRHIARTTERWCEPVRQLRREVGLPAGENPLFEGQFSRLLALAMFSPAMGEPQTDWPASMRQTGFCFIDDAREMPKDLQRFLDEGPAPVVFTLGSAAVLTAGEFFVESAKAARELGCRAVFIAGKETRIAPEPHIFVAPYAPYSQVFGRASVTVHQGGIGTTAQCMRAGCPALIVPFAHDQPDNAMRVERAGVGGSIPRGKYNAQRAVKALRGMVGNQSMKAKSKAIAEQIVAHDGVEAACRLLMEHI